MSWAIDAAAVGQSISFARSAVVARDLIEGRLIGSVRATLAADFAYWIVCPHGNAERANVHVFTSWLVAEAGRDVAILAACD